MLAMGISDTIAKLCREIVGPADLLALFQITVWGLFCLCCFPLENPSLLFSSVWLEWASIYVGLQDHRMHTQLPLINRYRGPMLFICLYPVSGLHFSHHQKHSIKAAKCWSWLLPAQECQMCAFCPSSMISHWYLEIGHGENVYIVELN